MQHVTETTRLRLRGAIADLGYVRSLLAGLDDPCVASARMILDQQARELRSAEVEIEAELDARAREGVEIRYGLTVPGLLALMDQQDTHVD